MGEQKTRKEILLEEISELNRKLEEHRKTKKNCSQLRKELIKLILELDNLEQDKEYKG
jgi:hypothetical protein